MVYNLTAIGANTTGYVSFIVGINNVLLHGFMGILLLIRLVSIIFIATYSNSGDFRSAMNASAFIGFVLAVMLKAIGLLPDMALFISLIVCAVAIATSWRSG